jgi:murein DD-endopeptidase MepM/ murein hydrolase activator NlpD
VVVFAGRVGGVGVVSVDHPGGLRTTYQPVTPAVARGRRVVRGQVLGLLAGSGGHCAPATCLHWGLRRGATYLDPLGLLGPSAARVRLLPVWAAGPASARTRGYASARTARALPTTRTGRDARVVAGMTAVAALGATVLLGRLAAAGGGRRGARRVRLQP